MANLGAANRFTIDHLDDAKNQQYIKNAKIIYTAVRMKTTFGRKIKLGFSLQGFFYTVCPDAVMRLCEHADKNDKLFCTNLSAPFICEIFGERLMKAMPYVDYLFGNETV